MPPNSKQVPINMRVSADKVLLIDVAAEMEGVNRTAFITRAATAMAEDLILNGPDETARIKKFQAFEDALDSYSPR
jgi:uncharacterized protein (DUF1778 family)